MQRNYLVVPTVREHRNAQEFRSKTGVVVRHLECCPNHVHSHHCEHVEVRVRHSLVLLNGLVLRIHGAALPTSGRWSTFGKPFCSKQFLSQPSWVQRDAPAQRTASTLPQELARDHCMRWRSVFYDRSERGVVS